MTQEQSAVKGQHDRISSISKSPKPYLELNFAPVSEMLTGWNLLLNLSGYTLGHRLANERIGPEPYQSSSEREMVFLNRAFIFG